jgi:hypothetical protein
LNLHLGRRPTGFILDERNLFLAIAGLPWAKEIFFWPLLACPGWVKESFSWSCLGFLASHLLPFLLITYYLHILSFCFLNFIGRFEKDESTVKNAK